LQIFYRTSLCFALVNLKPLLPGHVLICPFRHVQRVADLNTAEATDFFLTVRRVGRMVERVYGATSLNIAIQDGIDAGQTVPHVHAHIIPRRKADLDARGGSDAIYEMLDGEEGNIARQLFEKEEKEDKEEEEREEREEEQRRRTGIPAVDNEARRPRSDEEMAAEAKMLAMEMEKEPLDER
jgi:diadenosine tetraphosphate (Ap4A) HIT family hydrolase